MGLDAPTRQMVDTLVRQSKGMVRSLEDWAHSTAGRTPQQENLVYQALARAYLAVLREVKDAAQAIGQMTT